MQTCPQCQPFHTAHLLMGINPRGKTVNGLWQMDVTQVPEFGKLKFLHHSIETYSHFSWASVMSTEKADTVITHLLEAFAVMGKPRAIKIDNGSAYLSGKYQHFFQQYWSSNY